MTQAQLKNILQSNVLTVSPVTEETLPDAGMHIESGAHILLAPPCPTKELLREIFIAAGDRAFVAGCIGAPAEPLTELGGTLSYEAYYEHVLEQAKFLEDSGVALIFLTDFTDALAAKCAVYAVREASALPICIGFSVGSDAAHLQKAMSLLVTLQGLEVSAVGITGSDIEDTLECLSDIQGFASVPLFALCRASRFLEPEDYGDYVPSFVNQKCAMLGLSQKSPAFTAAATKALWQLSPLSPEFPHLNAVSSVDETLFLDFTGKIVGNNKQLLEIKTESLAELKQALSLFNRPGAAPVCFTIRDMEVLEYAIMHYMGRPAVRSDEYGEILARELGAFVLDATDKKKEDE